MQGNTLEVVEKGIKKSHIFFSLNLTFCVQLFITYALLNTKAL